MKIEGVANFKYEEFFSAYYFKKWKDTPYWLINSIDIKLPLLAQFLRGRYGKSVIINNWLWRGESDYPYDDSGFRDEKCLIGSKVSRHKLGKKIDAKVAGMEAAEVQMDIRNNYEDFKKFGLTAMEEDTETWTDLSVENTDWRREEGLWIVPNPNKKRQ